MQCLGNKKHIVYTMEVKEKDEFIGKNLHII